MTSKRRDQLSTEWASGPMTSDFTGWLVNRIEELEATLSAPVAEKAVTMQEWANLSPESRHNLSVMNHDFETLAALVLIADAHPLDTTSREEIRRLAVKYAPPHIAQAAPKLRASPIKSMFGDGNPTVTGVFTVDADENQNAHFRAVDGGE